MLHHPARFSVRYGDGLRFARGDLPAPTSGEPVVVGGFSSGGGLAAPVCLQARDTGSFRPALQVLGVPALDMATEVDPRALGLISRALRARVRRVYFPERERRREPYAGIDVVRDCTPGAYHQFLSHDLRRARGTMALTAREIVRRTVEPVT